MWLCYAGSEPLGSQLVRCIMKLKPDTTPPNFVVQMKRRLLADTLLNRSNRKFQCMAYKRQAGKSTREMANQRRMCYGLRLLGLGA